MNGWKLFAAALIVAGAIFYHAEISRYEVIRHSLIGGKDVTMVFDRSRMRVLRCHQKHGCETHTMRRDRILAAAYIRERANDTARAE